MIFWKQQSVLYTWCFPNVLKCCGTLNYFLGKRRLAWCIKGCEVRFLSQSINQSGIGDSVS